MSDTFPLHRLEIGNVSWLFSEMEPTIVQPLSQSAWDHGTTLRSTETRRVFSLDGPRSLLVKHFYHRNLAKFIAVLFKDTPAAREWRKIQQAQRLGIPTAQPLALGRRSRLLPRESVLVIELLAEAVPLDSYLFGPGRPHGAERRQVIREVAALVRRAHDVGWRQRDFHLGNILIMPEPAKRKIFLIDFQRADFLRRPADKTRWRDLAVLHGGAIAASRAHRLRFLKEYLSIAPPISADIRMLATRLERRGARHRHKLWHSREKRCLAENRNFVRIRHGAFRGAARRGEWTPELKDLLDLPHGGGQGGESVKDSRTSTVAAVRMAGKLIYLKRYNFQGWTYALKGLLRRARARRVWVAANSCVMRGLGVAPPLAYLERRRFGLLLESYLVTEAVQGEKLTSWLARHGRDFRQRRALVRVLARSVGRMHERLVQNRDLKADNLIVAQEQANSYAVFMVDFDGVGTGPVSWRTRVKNLTRLERGCRASAAITRTDRLRFLRTYLGRRFEDQWKKYWRRIARQADVD